jgi:hypothetical protein
MTPPAWSEAQLKAKQLEWKGRVRLGKRKFREESDLSNTAPRSLPTTINPAKLTLDAGLDAGFDTGTIQRTIAPIAPMGQ